MLAGANIFRLNMSHATHEWVHEVSKKIRTIAKELELPIGILMDTQGPAIRTGDLKTKLDLQPGDILELSVRGERNEDVYSVDVNYEGLINDINVGDTVLVDNGIIHLKVLSKEANHIRSEVLTAGLLGSRRHINLPGVKVNLPPLTAKDLADIECGVAIGADYFALSFCREASDILELKKVLAEHGSPARVIAKIEDQHAVKVLNEIIEASDAIMVARGDLGVECPLEELPIIQRRIVKKCLQMGRQVIVATHMLESMIENPLPTRAEITDVANAVYEQADAIMLSGETTVGKYPVDCVKIFDRVSRRTEESGGAGFANEAVLSSLRHKAVKSAIVLADSIPDSHLLVFTKRGFMADHVSLLRPVHSRIFAFTPSDDVARRLTLNWSVEPMVIPFDLNPEYTLAAAEKFLVEKGYAKSGDQLIVLSDIVSGSERFDSIQLRKVI